MIAIDIDLFAGPGGWDWGARALGLDPLGVEWDDAACATRRAAGLRTVQADVAGLDPLRFAREECGLRPGGDVRLLIASPPCQAFSMAGKGAGRRATAAYAEAIATMWERGSAAVDRAGLDEKCEDPRAHLVLEPLRWAMALRPRAIALEQVEPVLPLWEATAAVLRRMRYRTWTGILTAERYGTPQTRKRAILMASLDRQPVEPPATHQRFVPGRVKAKQSESLFDAPEPERIVLPEDRDLLPWVSMAEVLGWAGDDRVGFPRRSDTPSNPSSGSVEIDGVEYRERDFRDASERAFTVTEKARSVIRMRANAQANAAERSVEEPAPTIKGGHDTADRVWVTDTGNTRSGQRSEGRSRSGDEPAPVVTSRADQLERRDEPPEDVRWRVEYRRGGDRLEESTSVDEPAPAVTSRVDRWQVKPEDGWTEDRPATTVAGDARVFPPGHKLNEDDLRAGRGGQQRSGAGWTDERPATTLTGTRRSADGGTMRAPSEDRPERGGEAKAVRVTTDEAAVLQGFPWGYPWQGTRTAQYRQIGDAFPPPVARAVLMGLLS